MKNLLLLFICLIAGLLHAQEPVQEGYIRYLIVHNWTKKMAAVDYISKQTRERISYMWGKDSEWKVYANMYFNPNETRYEDSEEVADDEDMGYSWRKDAYLIRRNFSENKTRDVIQVLGKVYQVEDSIQAPAWKLLNDMKEVAGHICMNAYWYDSLKMQSVNAWFALDIPVSGGPERFCGLPGMILEVDVNDGGMLITADKIEPRKLSNELVVTKKYKGKKVDEAGYRAVIRKHMEQKRKEEQPPFWGIRY